MDRSLVIPAFAALGLPAVGCSGTQASRPAREGPCRVQVASAKREKLPKKVVAVGTLAAEERAELSFKVPGRMARWEVDLGSRVSRGTLLAELDARDFELRREGARAALEQARTRLGLPVGGDDDAVDSQNVGIVRGANDLRPGGGDAAPRPGDRAGRRGAPLHRHRGDRRTDAFTAAEAARHAGLLHAP